MAIDLYQFYDFVAISWYQLFLLRLNSTVFSQDFEAIACYIARIQQCICSLLILLLDYRLSSRKVDIVIYLGVAQELFLFS